MRFIERRPVAAALHGSGLLRLLECLPRRPGLLVMNYHRIGRIADNPFDDGTFSADADGFRRQMEQLRRRYAMPPLSEVLDAIERGRFEEPTALATFDDGYRDNHEQAFPILRELGLTACFFVATGYLDRPVLPWWDRVAYIVKRTRRATLELDYPEPLRFDLSRLPAARVIRRILRAYKDARPLDEARFFEQLEARAGVVADPEALGRTLFMSWEQVREMHRAGMAIGSHSVSHRVLASLPEDEQRVELEASRRRLADVLGAPPEALAYPVGGPTSFTASTQVLARAAGYRAAFRFFGGLNVFPDLDRYTLSRLDVEHHETFAQFRARVAFAR